jgi:hypothetical protein
MARVFKLDLCALKVELTGFPAGPFTLRGRVEGSQLHFLLPSMWDCEEVSAAPHCIVELNR